MPTQDCLWLHDQERVLPRLREPGEQDESHAVHRREPHARDPAAQDDHLLTKQGVFDQQVLLAAHEIGRRAEPQSE